MLCLYFLFCFSLCLLCDFSLHLAVFHLCPPPPFCEDKLLFPPLVVTSLHVHVPGVLPARLLRVLLVFVGQFWSDTLLSLSSSPLHRTCMFILFYKVSSSSHPSQRKKALLYVAAWKELWGSSSSSLVSLWAFL